MAHAQKPDFIFRWNGQVHLNQRGRQFIRLLAAEVCASAVVMLDTPCSEVVWRVLVIHSIRQFPLHFSTRTSPCAITFQLESTSVRDQVCEPWERDRSDQAKRSGKCIRVGMFAQINLSWEQRDNYSLGTLSNAQLVSHLSNVPAVGKPLEGRVVTNLFFYSSVYYLSHLVL